MSGRAQTLLALANAGRPIRPSGARNPTKSDPFESMQTANLLLAPLGYEAVREEDLPGLRRLAELVREIAERSVDGKPCKEEVSDLNDYSRQSHGWLSLDSGDRGDFRTEMVWEDGLLEGDLARQKSGSWAESTSTDSRGARGRSADTSSTTRPAQVPRGGMRRIPAAGASVKHADEGMPKPKCSCTWPLDTPAKGCGMYSQTTHGPLRE